jgi:hypothetical protein
LKPVIQGIRNQPALSLDECASLHLQDQLHAGLYILGEKGIEMIFPSQ